MQKLLQDIKKQDFSHIYLLCGEEDYLRKQYRDKLRQVLAQPEDTMNTHYYEGKEAKTEEVMELAKTLPFFASRRVIIIENSGWFSKGGDRMAQFLEELPETTYLIFVEAETDKRTKLYKGIKKWGRVAEFSRQEEATLKKWIMGMIKKEDMVCSPAALNFFLERTGTEMSHIKMEMEKLICYCMGRREITIEDVEAICCKRIQNQIFEMISALALRQREKALSLYYDLLSLKEPPMRILALIVRQFNLLLQVKEMKKNGCTSAVISQKTGLHTYLVGKYERQAAEFRFSELRSALEDCAKAEEEIKTGVITDRLSVELFLVKYSGKE